MASGSKVQLVYIKESTWGTTPATPTMQAIPFKTWNMKSPMDTFDSKQIYSDGKTRGTHVGLRSATAELVAEFVPDSYDDFMAGLFGADWSTNVLSVGVTAIPFSIQEGHSDISKFRMGTGLLCNKMGLSIKKGILDISFGFTGKAVATAGTSGASSITAASAHPPIDSLSAVISIGGSTVATITELDLTVERPIELGEVCNQTTPTGYGQGLVKASGSFTALVEDDALFTSFLAGAEVALSVTVGVAAGGIYAFALAGVTLTDHDSPVDTDGILHKKLTFTADVAAGFTVTRTPAA